MVKRFIGIIVILVLVAASNRPASANPYRNIDWDTIAHHRANLHTHTTQSDGEQTPNWVVDAYRQHGYTILALTDHNRVTYPWTDFTSHKPSNGARRRLEAGDIADLDYENRDPAALGMLAVQGAEASRHHHMGTYFCDVPGIRQIQGERTVEMTLTETRQQNGLAVMFHPGRYDALDHRGDWADERYVKLYQDWKELIGVEVYNQNDRYPQDRDRWDRLLTALMPDRPVWGHANDDFHRQRNFARSWSVFLLPELTEDALRHAMMHGHSFFSQTRDSGGSAPTIHAVRASADGMTLTIEASGHARVVWISEGREVHAGEQISLNAVADVGSYVRARVFGADGRSWSYTQPIRVPRTE